MTSNQKDGRIYLQKGLHGFRLLEANGLVRAEYNIAIADEDRGERFDNEAKDTFTLTLPPLRLVFSSK
jgi:hypothetical protein